MFKILDWFSPQIVGYAAIIAVLVYGYFYIHHDGYKEGLLERDKVQASFDKFKADQKAAAEKQAGIALEKERVQDEKTDKAKRDYKKIVKERDDAIASLGDFRLCRAEDMPRGESVRMAEPARNAMRPEPESPSRIDETASLAATFKFSDAVKDRDQCKGLIFWVCSQGMCDP